ncbi:MAG: HD domain-containing protein [Sphingobacteriales bacterium]|nr:MAG: HD domain-containing protein [Sphingobacteriales bacterium]
MLEITATINFVKQELAGAEAGHNWFHVERVYKTALHIAHEETADVFVVQLAALLHDIADSKFNNGNEDIGPAKATQFLRSLNINETVVVHVQQIIKNMSFKNSFDKQTFTSKEMQVVQDADRLDAMGAIGIARAFNYGGFKNRDLYNPAIAPNLNQNKEEYKNSSAPTINHFYEKLLLLKNTMHTQTGKKLAEERHQFMLVYLAQFYAEWEGKK